MVYFFLVFESDLSNSHAAVFLEIGPRRINNRDIVFLIPYEDEISMV